MSNQTPFDYRSRETGKDEWLTPPEIIRACGDFDLDPCAPIIRPWDMAENHYTIQENGLVQPWRGRVWVNPPYGNQTGEWMNLLAQHRDGVGLIFARTETKMFFDYVWERADAILFLKGRLSFYHVDGTKAQNSGGAPSCLIAYGQRNVKALEESGLNGKLILLTKVDLGKRQAKEEARDLFSLIEKEDAYGG